MQDSVEVIGVADGNGVSAPKKTGNKATIEKTYQKKSQLEHILLRPDTYIGSAEHTKELMWIYDCEKDMMIQRDIEFVPGLYKIYDEILVNAADNKQRDKTMDTIKIEINAETNTISVWNNGQGIPVVMHKVENMFVPTMIFGHLLTSSNYNDEEEKVTGGRNGYGAKLCNIFSDKFTVETGNNEYKKQFKQTWGSNMSKASEPKIKEFFGEDFTKITFSPDLAKFKMDKLDDDIIALMTRRAYDVAASTRGVKVFLNGIKLPIKNFKDYIDLYIKDKEDDLGNPLKVIYENLNERWEVACTVSDRGFQQVSFVNSIATTKGGRHVDYIAEMLTKQMDLILKKKNKGGVNIKPFQIKSHMWLFINCLIVNPTFDSQTKDNMTLQAKKFGSKCVLPEKFINQVSKCGIVELILTWAKTKAEKELSKVGGGRKQAKLKGIPKLEDANKAGEKNALKCTLILTEGDSAKSLAVAGLSVIGRDYYGVFPLRGKLLNVREATHKQLLENAEINSLTKIIGLERKKKYNNEADMKTLRYGKVMIMTDQDQDGSHIKGLLINFIHNNWPELLRQNFLEVFITPIVKVKKRNTTLSFYSLPEFEEWKSNTADYASYSVKYYKGLGTSDSKEAKEYFRDMARHRIRFRYAGQQDDDHIVLAFSRKHVEHRKEWLTNFMVESKRRKEIGLPEKYLYTKDTKFVSYTDFVNLELVLFSNADNVRSIPCLVDGIKPGQRKILFTCFKRNDKREVKVAQLAGSVAEHSAYHHGEVSLCSTIVGLAQNFVGSNNINLLEPRGQFGTRLNGGKDSASPRYIFTKLSPLTRLIFHPHDDPLLKHEYDDNKKIEPVWYIPIIPMVLVNGADGIGTGWMTKIPNYNPRELVNNLRKMIDDEDLENMMPFYKNFKGTIEDCGDHRYVASGEIAIIGNDELEITELPIGTWTQNYKENVLEVLLHGSEKSKPMLKDYKEYNSDLTVRFVITCLPGKLQEMEEQGLHKIFKLQNIINTSSMCVFDELGCMRRFESVMDILTEFFTLRLKMYEKRKNYIEGALEAEASKLSFQAKFIVEKCSGELVVENKKRKTIVDELIKRQYPADPVSEWKKRIMVEEDEGEPEEEEDEQDITVKSEDDVKNKKVDKDSADVKRFDYLLGMSMWMLTEERKNELLRQRDNKLAELDALKRKTPKDLWKTDLDAFLEKLNSVEEKEHTAETKVKQELGTKKALGKKTTIFQETMPSPKGRRVLPKVTDEMKKKIHNAVKLKENKVKKGIKKENIADDDKDEFDMMIQSKKTLKDKLGTPEEIENKVKKRKSKDGLIQTKLNFKPIEKKCKGSPKKREKKKITSDSDDDVLLSDSDVETVAPVAKERTVGRRAAASKVTKYRLSESSNDSGREDPVLLDNSDVKEDFQQERIMVSSESEDESPPPKNESSEDLFDSLIGKRDDPEIRIPAPSKPNVNATKKRIVSSSESDLGDKIKDDSEFDSDFEVKKPKRKKKKDDSDDEFVVSKKVPPKKKVATTTTVDPDIPKQPKKRAAPSKKPAIKRNKKQDGSSDSGGNTDEMKIPSDEDFGSKKSAHVQKSKKVLNVKKTTAKKKTIDSGSDDGNANYSGSESSS